VQDDEIYALFSPGERELKGSNTVLSQREIELLVRLDGTLTLGQIRAGMPAFEKDAFFATVSQLCAQGFMGHKRDSFSPQLQFAPNRMAVTQAQAEGEAGTASLSRAGYYVSIARARGPARPLGPHETLTALVVEDEPALAKFIQSYLSFEGFNVRIAGNRQEILTELRSLPLPNLVLLDVVLPDADGFDILLRMRQHPVLKNVPVIMLTGKATRESVIKGLANGADGYVTKPFEADALMAAVRCVLGLGDDESSGPDSWRVD
jgi:two-component system OmpR family response regulator